MLRFLSLVVLGLSSVLTVACASTGAHDQDTYPYGLVSYSHQIPPKCPYEEVGRLVYDRHFRTGTRAYTTEGVAERRRLDENLKRDLLEAFDERGADAFIVGVSRGMKQYSLIRFTDPDCRE